MATARGPPLPPLPPTHTLTPPDARALYLKRRYFTQPPPPEVAGVRDLRASGPRGPIPLRLYRPFGPPDTAVLLVLVYYHGGGHAIGDLETHDTLCRELANSRTSRVAPSLRLITVWVPSTASRRRWAIALPRRAGFVITQLSCGLTSHVSRWAATAPAAISRPSCRSMRATRVSGGERARPWRGLQPRGD